MASEAILMRFRSNSSAADPSDEGSDRWVPALACSYATRFAAEGIAETVTDNKRTSNRATPPCGPRPDLSPWGFRAAALLRNSVT